jgi:glutaconate CoA-transferase subunit B
MAKKYTLDELLIISAAREIKDGDNVILGVGLPTTAGAMAKSLHAPNATLMMESGIIDFKPNVPPNHIADANSCKGFMYATDLFSMFTMTYRGYVDVCFLGVAQIDRYGNINTTVIGDYYKPAMRLPGSGGACDFMSYARHTILTMRGGNFVEKLDYFTSPGYLEGGDSRDRSGLFPKGSGPSMLLTTKGIFRFDDETKELYLVKVHPGITVEMIKKDIPWDLKVTENISQTEPPSDAEINFIRRFAPTESVGRKVMYELSIINAMKKAQTRQKLS